MRHSNMLSATKIATISLTGTVTVILVKMYGDAMTTATASVYANTSVQVT